MSATVHLVLGPAGADRAGRVLTEYRTASSAGFGTALILTRTRRHAEQLRARLGPGLTPLLFDLQTFADELVRRHNPADDATPGHDSDYLSESKEAGVDVRQLLKTNPARGAGGSSVRLGRAAEGWDAGLRRPFHRVRSVFLVGFLSMSPPERKLLDALRATLEGLWVELPEGDGEAFAGARAVREWAGEADVERVEDGEPGSGWEGERVPEWEGRDRLSGRVARFPAPSHPHTPEPTVHLIEAPGELAETRMIARQVRSLLAEGARADRLFVVARRLDGETAARLAEVAGQGVRVWSAEEAAGRDCDYLFLVGLGEGSWPDLSAPLPAFGDRRREELRRAGFVLSVPALRLGAERLLFLSLTTSPRRGLFLSYSAADHRGRRVKPSKFLREFTACFPPDVVQRPGEEQAAQTV